MATKLIALIDEFDERIRDGRVPPAFAERLSELWQAAERLIGP